MAGYCHAIATERKRMRKKLDRMAAMLGTLPIAIGFGAGGGARRPLGLTVVGGLFFSQLITLYLTPVIYTYLDALQEKARHWLRFSRKEETQAVEPNIK